MHTSPSDVHTSSIDELRAAVRGPVITPDKHEYDQARSLFYSGFDRRPAALVRVADVADVSRVVSFARQAGLDLAVRSGGHSLAGHGVVDGGITLDLSAMKALEIDVPGRTAWAETRLTAGEYTSAVGAHGLATGFGDTPSVGIGGITLGGGVGFLHRKLGLTIDSLIAAEVVTADGEVVRTDAATHQDLFWAIRGGGGNFGVVTRFQFRLHEVDEIVGGIMMFPANPSLIAAMIDEATNAPESLSGMINVMAAPPMPFIPAEHHGRLIALAMLVNTGSAEEGERVFAPFRTLATPLADMVRPMRYPDIYEGGDAPHPSAVAVRSFFLDGVDSAAGELVVEQLQASTAPMRAVQFRVLGGAVARVPTDATAFAHRGRKIMVNVAAAFERPGEASAHAAWADGCAAQLRQGEPGAYVGFLSDEGEARIREAYPGATWERLAEVKARYDPTNLFRLNQNIPPSF